MSKLSFKPSGTWIRNLILHHGGQNQIFYDPHLFKVLVCGRGWGKSVLQIASMIKALDFPHDAKIDPISPPVILGAMPTLVQAKPILWRPLVSIFEDCPIVEEINKSEHFIAFKGNRPAIKIIGLNDKDGDGARGLKLWRFHGDEMQDIRKGIYDEIIEPALGRMQGSQVMLTGTPKGKLNPLYEFYNRPALDPTWASWHYKTIDNPWIDPARIEKARSTMSPRLFEQEYLASFVNFEGQIYSEFDPDLNVVSVLPERFDAVWIAHDPGDVNPALMVVGEKDKVYYILDSWKGGDGANAVPYRTVQEKVLQLCKTYNPYRMFVDPSRPGIINDFRVIGKQQEAIALQRSVTAYNKVEEGLNITNNLFFQRKLMVASHLTELAEKIQSYHRKRDKAGNVMEVEESGQDTHELDCLRYICASLHQSRRTALY